MKNSKTLIKAAPEAPERLSAEAQGMWKRLLADYVIEDEGGLAVLTTALEAFDRMREAQAVVTAEGMSVLDRFGQTKSHPLLLAERDFRTQYLSALKQLRLPFDGDTGGAGRPFGS